MYYHFFEKGMSETRVTETDKAEHVATISSQHKGLLDEAVHWIWTEDSYGSFHSNSHGWMLSHPQSFLQEDATLEVAIYTPIIIFSGGMNIE